MMDTQAYLYKWTHIPTGRWYLGSRTAQGCHPDDGYICSSKIVKPLILANPNEWNREILIVAPPDYILELESIMLQTFDCASNPKCFNRHNNTGKFTTTGIEMSEEHRKKISRANKGKKKKPFTEEHREKMRLAKLGKPGVNKGKKLNLSEEQRKQLSERIKSRPPWNKGKKLPPRRKKS